MRYKSLDNTTAKTLHYLHTFETKMTTIALLEKPQITSLYCINCELLNLSGHKVSLVSYQFYIINICKISCHKTI